MLTLQMARMCFGVAICVRIGLSTLGFPGRKTDVTIGFGLSAMHEVVLGLAWVIEQLVLDESSQSCYCNNNCCRHVWREKTSRK
jgi:hypothetical protein